MRANAAEKPPFAMTGIEWWEKKGTNNRRPTIRVSISMNMKISAGANIRLEWNLRDFGKHGYGEIHQSLHQPRGCEYQNASYRE